jgi:pyocin large subunit-like protein
MNAILTFILWAVALFGSPANVAERGENVGKIRFHHNEQINTNGVHIMNGNPRTVVALEDTHFRPM